MHPTDHDSVVVVEIDIVHPATAVQRVGIANTVQGQDVIRRRQEHIHRADPVQIIIHGIAGVLYDKSKLKLGGGFESGRRLETHGSIKGIGVVILRECKGRGDWAEVRAGG